MKHVIGIIFIFGLVIMACSGKNPVSPIEATDEEAIYNVLFQDNYRITVFDFFKIAIPDTAAFLANPDPNNPCIWHDVQYTSENLVITILDNPVQSPVGLVMEGHVTYTINDTGKFRIIMYNSAADSIERDSVKFNLTMTRSATCQQWGRTNTIRRGWLLTSISDARVSGGQNYPFLSGLRYSSVTHADTSFVYGTHEPGEMLKFSPSEEISIRYQTPDSLDKVFIYIPSNNYGYRLATPQKDSLGVWRATFTMPSVNIYGQLFFYVVNVGNFNQAYRASGYSFNYRIR
jgi:hypothetical protein